MSIIVKPNLCFQVSQSVRELASIRSGRANGRRIFHSAVQKNVIGPQNKGPLHLDLSQAIVIGRPQSLFNNLGIHGLIEDAKLVIAPTEATASTVFAVVSLHPAVDPVERWLFIDRTGSTRALSDEDPLPIHKGNPSYVFLEDSSICFQISWDDHKKKVVFAHSDLPQLSLTSNLVDQSSKRLEELIHKWRSASSRSLCPDDSQRDPVAESPELRIPLEFVNNEQRLSLSMGPRGRHTLKLRCSAFPPDSSIVFTVQKSSQGEILPSVSALIDLSKVSSSSEYTIRHQVNTHLPSSNLSGSPVSQGRSVPLINPPQTRNLNLVPSGSLEFKKGMQRYTLSVKIERENGKPQLVLSLAESPDRRDGVRIPDSVPSPLPSRQSSMIGVQTHIFSPQELKFGDKSISLLQGFLEMQLSGDQACELGRNREVLLFWPARLPEAEARQNNRFSIPILLSSFVNLRAKAPQELSGQIASEARTLHLYYRNPQTVNVGDFLYLPEGKPLETIESFRSLNRVAVHFSDIYEVKSVQCATSGNAKRFLLESTDNLAMLTYSDGQEPLSCSTYFPGVSVNEVKSTLFTCRTFVKRQTFGASGVGIGMARVKKMLVSNEKGRGIASLINWPFYYRNDLAIPNLGITVASSGTVTVNSLLGLSEALPIYLFRNRAESYILTSMLLQPNDILFAKDPATDKFLPLVRVVNVPGSAPGRSDLPPEARRFVLDMFVI